MPNRCTTKIKKVNSIVVTRGKTGRRNEIETIDYSFDFVSTAGFSPSYIAAVGYLSLNFVDGVSDLFVVGVSFDGKIQMMVDVSDRLQTVAERLKQN